MPFSTLKVRRRRYGHRHALEHHGGGLLVADIRRQLDRAIGRHKALGGVAAGTVDVGDAVAALEFGDAGADLDHLAGGLIAGHERQPTGTGYMPMRK